MNLKIFIDMTKRRCVFAIMQLLFTKLMLSDGVHIVHVLYFKNIHDYLNIKGMQNDHQRNTTTISQNYFYSY